MSKQPENHHKLKIKLMYPDGNSKEFHIKSFTFNGSMMQMWLENGHSMEMKAPSRNNPDNNMKQSNTTSNPFDNNNNVSSQQRNYKMSDKLPDDFMKTKVRLDDVYNRLLSSYDTC